MAAPIIVLTGPPGAGKTTVTRLVAASYEHAVHLRGDEFFHVIAAGFVPPWEPASQRQNEVVLDATCSAALTYAHGGYTVVLDVLLGPWFLERFVDTVLDRGGAPVHYVVLRPDEATCLARATARGAGELVDPEPIHVMCAKFNDLGPYERHVLDVSGTDPAGVARAVGDAVASGAFRLASSGGPAATVRP